MPTEVYVVGPDPVAGLLADAIPGALRATVAPSAEVVSAAGSPLVILASDSSTTTEDLVRQQRCLSAGADVLHVRLVRHLGFVGPWVRPGRPGCLGCAERWRAAVLRQRDSSDRDTSAARVYCRWLPWLATLVDVAAAAVTGGLDVPFSDGGWVYALRATDLSGRLHRFLPEPTCPDCSDSPPDDAELARLRLEPRPQPDPLRFRVQPEPPDLAQLEEKLVDWRYGPVVNLFRNERSPFSLTVADIARLNGSEREGGFGRTSRYPPSKVVALLEALERLGSARPTRRRTVVRGSYAELAADAVDPASLGMHEPACYEHPACLLVPYTPETVTNWVWAYSLRRDRPVLVPEHVAFYDAVSGRRDPNRFLYESSNGCATGTCLEEAVLYALCEVIERDAFLLTWYRQAPVREVAVDDGDVELGHLVDRLASLGYTLHALDATNEFGVPAIISAAVRVDDEGPKAFLAAGAHPDPRRAVRSAIAEVATNVVLYPQERTREELLAMWRDPDQVRTLDDHVALYTLPEAFERVRFLFPPGRPVEPVDEVFPDWRQRWVHEDLTVVLTRLLQRIYELEMDVIVVDQTPPEPLACGLRTVKALVPGTVPMTFGHVHRRTVNLPRLTGTAGPGTPPSRFDPHPFP